MPGSVSNAAPSTTLPYSLSIAFVRSQTYELLNNDYANGESQRSVFATTSRKRWSRQLRLTATEMADLRTFYLARGGRTEPFFYFDPWETSPLFTSIPSGTQGRYTVRFDCDWSQEIGLGRGQVGIEFVETA